MNSPDLAALSQQLDRYFNEGELRTLCFDLGLDYDNLPGRAKGDQARELVAHGTRHGTLPVLLARVRALRPHVAWGTAEDGAGTAPGTAPVTPVPAPGSTRYQATLHGDGAIAQGPGSSAVGARGVSIGGSATGSQIVSGDGNVVAGRDVLQGGSRPHSEPGGAEAALARLFEVLVARMDELPPDVQEEVRPAVEALQAQLTRIQQGDSSEPAPGILARRLRTLKVMAGEIAAVALTTLANPASGVALVIQQVAERVQVEG